MSKARKGKPGSKKARKRSKARAAKRGSNTPRAVADAPAVTRAARPSRKKRLAMWTVAVLAYVALMWFVVFPWVDATFVNQPAL